MKKIIINGRFLLHAITGVERYAREIVSSIDKIITPGEVIMAVPPETKKIPEYNNIEVVKVGKLHNRIWEHVSFPIYVLRQHGISLNLCNTAPIPAPGIVCIHDMKIKAVPEYFNKKFVLWYNLLFINAIKRSEAVITISKFSKSEIVKYYHINPQKITVVPCAWQHYGQISYNENTLVKYKIKKNGYYFSMGSLEPNKNFKWIAEMARNNPDEQFVIAGSVNSKVFAKKYGFECPENMKLLGYISDEEAKTLMRDCKVFLFPTFYEGFGMPPLEAMSAGCNNIMVSDTKVMHEIFRNSVDYIDPYNYCFKIKGVKKCHKDKCIDILDKYSWEDSAKILACLIKNI